MRANKYQGTCTYCNQTVPANGGVLLGKSVDGVWGVAHLACRDARGPQVVATHFPNTGNTVYRNVRGRCEDAPCCGCCS
jgi:hypothetical protein